MDEFQKPWICFILVVCTFKSQLLNTPWYLQTFLKISDKGVKIAILFYTSLGIYPCFIFDVNS
jgi:hypothetical protein